MNFGRVDYGSGVPPKAYRCAACDVHGCKLWRSYAMIADCCALTCADCSGKDQQSDVSQIDSNGKVPYEYGGRIDQIGSKLPAVPTEEGDTYWGYTSVPSDGVKWWKNLPTRITKSSESSGITQEKNGPSTGYVVLGC